MGSKNPKMDRRPAKAFPTVRELISQLRSSFFATEFQNIANTLAEREEQMNDKSIELGKKLKAVEKDKDLLLLEKLKLQDELKKKENEFERLRKVTSEYKDQIRVLNLEKCKASKNSVLENELKRKQKEIDEIRKVNIEHERTITDLKSEKNRMEDEIRAYKKQFSELQTRDLSLEKTSKVLVASEGTFRIELENEQQNNNASAAADGSRAPLFDKEGDSQKRIESKFQEIIQIDDDDDDDDDKLISTLKRKRDSNEVKEEPNDDGTQKRKNLVSTPHSGGIQQNLPSFVFSSDSSSDSDADDINKPYKMIIAAMRTRKERWGFEDDLREELDKDDKLCMNAVCALYRQRVQWKLMSFGIDIIPAHDLSRIAQLAQLLINGDPHQKLNKTPSDLNRCDLYECRKWAKMYSAHLFYIYKKKNDPFFPPSTT